MQNERLNQHQWDAFVATNAADGGVLQSWQWGELQKALGRGIFRFTWKEETTNAIKGCCLLVEQKLPLGWTYYYAPRGPVVGQWHRKNELQEFLAELETFSRKQKVAFLRVEPPYENSTFHIPHYKHTFPIQPTQTLRIDLAQTEGQLLAVMHQKTRYNIHVAEKHNVQVTQTHDIEAFWELLQETTDRDGFRGHLKEHYALILQHLDASLFIASHHNTPLAAALVAFFGTTAYYLHGASTSMKKDVMAPYALHWQVMREAKRRGCTTYDLWGIDEKKWPGVTRFKTGFAPATPPTTYASTYDLPISKLKYAFYRMRKLFL